MTIRPLESGVCPGNAGSVVVPIEMVLATQILLANGRAVDTFRLRWGFHRRWGLNELNTMASSSSLQHVI
jgi:hypothetical protein